MASTTCKTETPLCGEACVQKASLYPFNLVMRCPGLVTLRITTRMPTKRAFEHGNLRRLEICFTGYGNVTDYPSFQ